MEATIIPTEGASTGELEQAMATGAAGAIAEIAQETATDAQESAQAAEAATIALAVGEAALAERVDGLVQDVEALRIAYLDLTQRHDQLVGMLAAIAAELDSEQTEQAQTAAEVEQVTEIAAEASAVANETAQSETTEQPKQRERRYGFRR